MTPEVGSSGKAVSRASYFRYNGRVLTLTAGLPASGKTTWALAAGFDHAVCLDDCRHALWGDPTLQNGPGGIPALLTLQTALIGAAMANGHSIVVHNTSYLKSNRQPLIEQARRAGYRVQIVYFDVAMEECLRRNRKRKNPVPDAVIEDFAARMEVPEADEADLVIRYSELG